MEGLEEIYDPLFKDEFSSGYQCVENGKLFNLATPSLATLNTGNGCMNSTITASNNSLSSNMVDFVNAEINYATRQRELNRLRQQRHREKKSKRLVIATEQLEHVRNQLRTEEEENTRLKQENKAMMSLIDNASSLLQKMKLSSVASLSRILGGPYQKILKMLRIADSIQTIEYVNDEFTETLYAFGAQSIIHAASLFLSKSQFRDIIHMPLTLVCKLMAEWCDNPERRPALEKILEVRFHRTSTYFRAIREIWPDVMESAICPTEDFRRKVKEQYLDHLNHEDLVQATRLTEDQKRKLRLAWREYQRRFCGLNALVTQSAKLLEMDCGGAGGDTSIGDGPLTVTSRDMTALPAFPQASCSNKPSLMALESLLSFQTSEREAYFDMIETTFIMTPLQWFRLRLLGLCSLEKSLLGMYLAVLQMM